MMDGNVPWKCTCTGMIAEIRMFLNTQSEDSYKMRTAVLLKRGDLFNVAASENSWRGLHRDRDLCSECTWRWAVSRYLFQVSWRLQFSGAWEGYSLYWSMELRDFLICNAISRHAFHCDRALVRRNTWQWPEQHASSHRICNVGHPATCFWCTWFLLVRGMMCQAVCLNLLSVQLLLQSIQRKWPAKDFLASWALGCTEALGRCVPLAGHGVATTLGWEGRCPNLGWIGAGAWAMLGHRVAASLTVHSSAWSSCAILLCLWISLKNCLGCWCAWVCAVSPCFWKWPSCTALLLYPENQLLQLKRGICPTACQEQSYGGLQCFT